MCGTASKHDVTDVDELRRSAMYGAVVALRVQSQVSWYSVGAQVSRGG